MPALTASADDYGLHRESVRSLGARAPAPFRIILLESLHEAHVKTLPLFGISKGTQQRVSYVRGHRRAASKFCRERFKTIFGSQVLSRKKGDSICSKFNLHAFR